MSVPTHSLFVCNWTLIKESGGGVGEQSSITELGNVRKVAKSLYYGR